VLITGEGRTKRVTLVDCGLSPRRVKAYLAEMHIGIERIDDVVLTHLDTDHCHAGWKRALPAHARFRIHRRHLGRAERSGMLYRRTEVFDDGFELATGVRARVVHASHDADGVAVFRFEVPPEEGFAHGASLGYATDIGRLTPGVVELLRGVDVLAIESNYCPRLQEMSNRPAMLKSRIMGGSGHLSNEEAAEAVRLIGPRRKVVLLHLSRQCNTPQVAGSRHGAAACEVVISDYARPTALIRL
jgi:phosphoribosyl 1,2-cyclic phosphodiesterase